MPTRSLTPPSLAALSITLVIAGLASPASAVPFNIVINGEFELVVPGGPEVCDTVGDHEVDLVVIIVDTCSPGAMKALHWSSLDGTVFGDSGLDSNPDREVILDPANAPSNHNFWQAFPSSHQAFSLDFLEYQFRLESGTIPSGANIQVGFSLSPGYAVHPFVGVFWEGALLFRANDMAPNAQGDVALKPLVHGEIICPAGYQPCLDYQAEYNAADDAGKHHLLGHARIVQNSFWNFNTGSGVVVLDRVAILGAPTAAEGTCDVTTDTSPPDVGATFDCHVHT